MNQDSVASLRQQMRQSRRQLTRDAQAHAALSLRQHFLNEHRLLKANRVGAYFPADGEINPIPLLNRLRQLGKQIYLPKLASYPKKMVFLPMTGKFKVNQYGLLEPVAAARELRFATDLDLILMPLVAFDDLGHRLGMGGGYYDRALSKYHRCGFLHRPKLVGLAHSFQQTQRLKSNNWDVPMHGVVTERSLSWF